MDLHLKSLFDRFQEQFGTGPGLGPGSGTCLMKVEGVTPNLIKSLFKASAALYRTEPWKRLRPGHILGVRVGKDSDWSGKKQPFPCVQFVGGDGGDVGLHMFRSENDARKMTGSRETLRAPNAELLRVTFEPESSLLPSNRKMVKALLLEPSGAVGRRFPTIDVARCSSSQLGSSLQFRSPSLEELRFAYAVVKAVSMVHPLLQVDRDGSGPKWSRLAQFEAFIETVDVQWAPEMAKGQELVAVTVSHPPGQGHHSEEKGSSTPTKYAEPPSDACFDQRLGGLRRCAACEKEVAGDEGLCCGRCRAVIYCGPVCQKQHWKDHHKAACGLYKAMMEREEELAMKIFSFTRWGAEQPCRWLESMGVHERGMWRRKCGCYAHCPFGLLPAKGGPWGGVGEGEYPRDAPLQHKYPREGVLLLSGWGEYYNLRSLPLSSPVADILSHPLTLHHVLTALSPLSKTRLHKGEEVVVHYLGPEGELDWMPAFAELGHLLNGSGNVHLIMVGPEVPTSLAGTTSGIGSRVRVNLVRGLYQEEATYLPAPHAVLALNCSLDAYPAWTGALALVNSMGVPAFFSDQSEISFANAKHLLRAAGLHITHPLTPNPFRSPVKKTEPSNNLPAYSNAFLLGVNT